MDIECDICGAPYDEGDLTTITTTYTKQNEDLKTTEKIVCDFCLYQIPDFVKIFGDGTTVEPDPDEEEEEDITGEDEGTEEVDEDGE